jgi:serine/threonine protein kinase
VIGRGGFSRVVLARKKDSGRLYALKIMKKHRIFREKKLKPIMSERNIMDMLKTKHPFIIKLHWAFQSVNLYYIFTILY